MLIKEEKWEIKHHRTQEKEELIEMYKNKGFSGKLLDQVVGVLMADDNRLLRVMLEEELGLSLDIHEHPLKYVFWTSVGILISFFGGAMGFFFYGGLGAIIVLFLVYCLATLLSCKIDGNSIIKFFVWNLSIFALSTSVIYFLSKWACS